MAPTHKKPTLGPHKKFMCLIFWEKTHKLFRGDLGGEKGVPNGPFSATKSSVYCFFPALISGGFRTAVRVRRANSRTPPPQVHLCLTSILPLVNLFNPLCFAPAHPAVSSHGLQSCGACGAQWKTDRTPIIIKNGRKRIGNCLRSRGPENGAFGKPCFCPARKRGFLTKMAKMTNLHSNQ